MCYILEEQVTQLIDYYYNIMFDILEEQVTQLIDYYYKLNNYRMKDY